MNANIKPWYTKSDLPNNRLSCIFFCKSDAMQQPTEMKLKLQLQMLGYFNEHFTDCIEFWVITAGVVDDNDMMKDKMLLAMLFLFSIFCFSTQID